MKSFHCASLFTAFLGCCLLALAGCGGSDPKENASGGGDVQKSADGTASTSEGPKRTFKPVALGAGTPVADVGKAKKKTEHTTEDVLNVMQPLQVLLGKWQGITRKTYEGFKAVDTTEWIWDFKTDPNQPALVMASDKSPYFSNARLTYIVEDEKFRLIATDKENQSHTLEGTWTAEPRDVPDDNNKVQRTFKLELTELASASAAGDASNELWQIVFNQQENNRYLMELARKRGSADFRQYDVVGTQREGTSFALDDTGYGEKTCIISQGLGVIQLSHNGKSYWVCCTGCQAAFEDDPETWIAKWEEKQKEMEKK